MLGSIRIKFFIMMTVLCGASPLFAAYISGRGNTVDFPDAIARENVGAIAHWLGTRQSVSRNTLTRALLATIKAAVVPNEETRLEVVKRLLNEGAPIEEVDELGRTPLMLAINGGHIDIAKLLLERGASMKARSSQGTSIFEFVPRGNVALMQLLLDNKLAIEAQDKWGGTILQWAVSGDDVPMVALLLERGAKTEVRNGYSGETLLLLAVSYRFLDVVRLLLQANADIEAEDKRGNRALTIAFEKRNADADMVSLLLEYGASCTPQQIADFVDFAVSKGHEKMLQSLELRKFPVADLINKPTQNGETLLMQYVIRNNYSVVALLLNHGANPFVRDAAGFTVFDYVRGQQKNSKMFLLFIEKFPEQMRESKGSVSVSPDDIPLGKGNTPTEVHYRRFSAQIELEKNYGKVLENPIVQECIAKERVAYEQDKYVFYHGEPGKYRIYEYLLQELDDLVRSFGKTTRDFIFTRFFKDAAQEMTINEYIDTRPWRANEDPTKNVLLSASMALFGNIYNKTSCPWYYFSQNASATKIDLNPLFESIFERYGFDKAYIKSELLPLQQGALDSAGSLLQIIVPKNIVDKVVMLADVGYCVPWPDMVDPSCWDPQAISADRSRVIKQGRHTCIASIIDKYRTGAIPVDDTFQMRIFMNAAYGLNPNSGITFNLYSTLPEARLLRLKEQIHAIADKMFGQWLADLVMSADRPLIMSSEELRAMLKHYGKGDVARQTAFFEAFKKKLHVESEERKYEADKNPVQEMGHAVAQVAARVAHEEIISDARKGVGVRSDAARLKEYRPATIWQEYGDGKTVTKQDMRALYFKDCARDAIYNARIPEKTARVVRIATYNVHLWKDLSGNHAYQDILEVIAQIQADVLVLQEVLMFDEAQIKKDLAGLGYVYPPTFAPMDQIGGVQFGTMIVSKYPFVQPPSRIVYAANNQREKRNFINAKIRVSGDSIVSVYGTHLDVRDETGKTRELQVRELLEHVQKDEHDNIVLAGDWNAVRRSDYEYEVAGKSVWDMQTEQFLKRVEGRFELHEIPTNALQDIERNNFKDCFTAAGIAGPKYTVWSGTEVDFIFCAQKWNLSIDGCYLYFSAASDHLPVIMDVRIAKTKFAKERDRAPQGEKGQVQQAAEREEEEKKSAQQE
ncbi:MAG TPA: ankyrin repeat domain-containing protein [Candidatus Babeliales bacterium]|nr:ankyrin repeat domain-containing protein [Candidatus Babeliales bacterium]